MNNSSSSNTSTNTLKCTCQIQIRLRKPIPAPVYLYYRIDNMYQNYMTYSISKDDYQLFGRTLDGNSELCGSVYTKWDQNQSIAPCGMIANSMFNDSFLLNRIIYYYKEKGDGKC